MNCYSYVLVKKPMHMLKTIYFSLISALFISLLIAGCTKDKENTNNDCSTTKSWTSDVSPIIQSSCAITSCHASGSANGPGALTSYQAVFNARTAIRQAVASGAMPKTGSLTAAQKNAIICWIDSGAPQN
jgi:hypothetical protein